MSKIPFAYDPVKHNHVEVGQVKVGKECNCVCPSCGQSVIARQGDIKQWHFAHDPSPKIPPIKFCEISFAACCRQFLMQHLFAKNILTLSLPDYFISVLGNLSRVTTARVVEVADYQPLSGEAVLARVGTHFIEIVFTWPGKAVHRHNITSRPCLEIDLDYVEKRYADRNTTGISMLDCVTELFAADKSHKRWLYHPRQESMKSALSGIPQQTAQEMAVSPQPHRLHCVMCRHAWLWINGQSRSCPQCNTHLYVTPV